MIFSNDGDTNAGLEPIAQGHITATVDTTPYVMGEVALDVAAKVLDNQFPGGWVETPVRIVDKTNVLPILQHPETLYPKPSKSY